MKRGTTPKLPVTFAVDNSNVQSIEFIFKQERKEDAPALVTKKYPEGVSYSEGVYHVPFTVADTLKFEGNKRFFMDTRLTTIEGEIPETPIVELFMNSTLFENEAVTE